MKNWKVTALAGGPLIVIASAVAFSQMTSAQSSGYAPGVDAKGGIVVPRVDYRAEWDYLGSFSVTKDDVDGVAETHVVYTQPGTIKAYRATGKYPDGAVLLKELYNTKTDDLTTGRASWNTTLKGWFVMVKDTKGRFKNNPLWGDGWGWAYFEAGSPAKTVTTDYANDCLSCHEPVRDTDLSYVQGYPALKGPGR